MDQSEFEHWQAVQQPVPVGGGCCDTPERARLSLLQRRGIGDLYADHPGRNAAGREL